MDIQQDEATLEDLGGIIDQQLEGIDNEALEKLDVHQLDVYLGHADDAFEATPACAEDEVVRGLVSELTPSEQLIGSCQRLQHQSAPADIPNEYQYMRRVSPPSYLLPSPPESNKSEPPYSPEDMLQAVPGYAPRSCVTTGSTGVLSGAHVQQQVPCRRPPHPQSQFAHYITGDRSVALATNGASSAAPTLTAHLQQQGVNPATGYPGPPPRKRTRPVEAPPYSAGGEAVSTISSGVMDVKPEPVYLGLPYEPRPGCWPEVCLPDQPAADCDGDDFTDSRSCANIKWQPYNTGGWNTVLDDAGLGVTLTLGAEAEKGFTFSNFDEAFVCQKKNHFQVSVRAACSGVPRRVSTEQGTLPIDHLLIDFFGVKTESPTQVIKVEQSQQDRTKRPFCPIKASLTPGKEFTHSVGRLHFSETTANNMRRKGKPNPDQRYFCLVLAIKARAGDRDFLLSATMTEKIIVRASNPGQFDNDSDGLWKTGASGDTLYTTTNVGIGTNKPDQQLTVHGNMRLTGQMLQPSDQRVKENIQEVDPKTQLDRVKNLRIYSYNYVPEYGVQAGMSGDELEDTGVLAQDIQAVMPDAVREVGDVVLSDGEMIDSFLVVNKDRIFMENVGAVKELCKLTDNLEGRIDELEKINRKIRKLKRWDSLKSTSSGGTVRSFMSAGSNFTVLPNTAPSTPRAADKRKSHCSPRCENEEKEASRGRWRRQQLRRESSRSSELPVASAAPQGPCSNRFIQIIIITLVLVMAFCLVSITTLYAMAKSQEKSTGSSSHVQATHFTLNPRETLSSSTASTPRPPDLPVLGRCLTLGSLGEELGGGCEKQCECVKDDSRIPSGDKLKLPTQPAAGGAGEGPKGPVSGQAEKEGDGKDQASFDAAGSPDLPEHDGSVFWDSSMDWDLPDASVTGHSSTQAPNPGYRVHGMGNSQPPVVIHSVRTRDRRRRAAVADHKVSSSALLLRSATVVELFAPAADQKRVKYNFSLDLARCEDRRLCSGEAVPLGSKLVYQVPVSRDLPPSFIQLQLILKDNNSRVVNCYADKQYRCEDSRSARIDSFPVQQHAEGAIFPLPVGYFMSVEYGFRVLPEQYVNHADACKSQAQLPYVDYTFYFYRYCLNSNAGEEP